MSFRITSILCTAIGACALLGSAQAERLDPDDPVNQGTFRFAAQAVQFDVSAPLRDIPINPPPAINAQDFFFTMPDDSGYEKGTFGPQSVDRSVQGFLGPLTIPPPIQNFDAGSGGANPPDPNGDVGPNHYVRMVNSNFEIYDKVGTSLFGPANFNTLFVGFGGDCENENAGDPIVLYDQLADRWLLTQFTDPTGPGFFNCVALSTTGDPTGTYFLWAFPTAVFPDYPKYGIWPNAYLISTRENPGNIGAYAVNRTEMLAGNPSPTLISFIISNQVGGDGLLPADLDGNMLPPDVNKAFFIGALDDGGSYTPAFDHLSIWEFDIDFATPTNSSFTRTDMLPITPYDTVFPCIGFQLRECIPQPPPLLPVDILSSRQRPINRAAYRNFGSYQSLVTNQSVEAAPALGSTRWWEIRGLGSNPVLYQDSTYAPGVTDGIHRWMASIAQDSAGNLGMGYSASSEALFPSVRYTGRLESDPLNEMRGEGVLVNGGGGHSNATVRRWGDYTSMNIDPVDDCTFWYINEYFATTGGTWTLRAGSFKFPECETPGGTFGVAAVPLAQSVCAPDDAPFTVETHGYNGFTGAATLMASGNPPGTTVTFAPPTIASVPGNTTMTIGNTAGGTFGSYVIDVSATSGATHQRSVALNLFTQTPDAPTLQTPVNGAEGASRNPTLTWTMATQGQTYVVEVATDSAFTNIVETSPVLINTSFTVPTALDFGTEFFWRVVSTNICGPGTTSATRSFTVRPAIGSCLGEDAARIEFADNMENGTNGWTVSPASGNTWVQSTLNPASGTTSWLGADFIVTADTTLTSPSVNIPADHAFTSLRFQHSVNMEENGDPGIATSCWDGGFVEISTDDGTSWAILNPTAPLVDTYTGPIPTGQQAWCDTRPYTTAGMDLSAFAGQDVRFRFRVLTDSNTGDFPLGWDVDDVAVISCGLQGDGFENP